MSLPKGVQTQSHGCSCQGCKATNHTVRNPPEPSESCIRNLHQHTEPSGTFRNLSPETTPGPSGTFRKLHPEPTPPHTGTFRNLLPEPTPAHTRTLRNLPELASGAYTPAHTGILRNLPEPNPPEPFSSGTWSWDPHRHTPELIWAEDPMSLRCWGKMASTLARNHPLIAWNRVPWSSIPICDARIVRYVLTRSWNSIHELLVQCGNFHMVSKLGTPQFQWVTHGVGPSIWHWKTAGAEQHHGVSSHDGTAQRFRFDPCSGLLPLALPVHSFGTQRIEENIRNKHTNFIQFHETIQSIQKKWIHGQLTWGATDPGA